MSRTRQLQGSGSAGHPVVPPCEGLLAPASRQPLPALPPPCRQAGKQVPVSSSSCVSRLALHSSGAGSQVPVSSFPCASRLPLQAGWRADGPLPQDFFLTTPSARLLPQDFLFKTSPGQPGSDTTEARFLPQDLQRADSSPCRLFLAVARKHVFSNLQCSNYYIRRP